MDHLGELVHVVEDAVDAHPHHRGVASRLDVHVAGPLVERIVKDVLHGGDHVAVAGLDLLDAIQLHVALEVADVDAGGGLLLGGVDRPAESVEIGDEPLDVGGSGHHQARLAAHVRLQRLDQRVVQGIGHGHGHRAIVGGDDQRPVPAREGTGEELGRELGVDLQRIEIDVGHPHVLRQGLHDDALGERKARVAALAEAQRHQRLGRVHAVGAAGPALAGSAGAQTQEARMRHVPAGHGVMPLLCGDEAALLQDAAQEVERQRGARRDRRSMGGVGRSSRHGGTDDRVSRVTRKTGCANR